MAGSLFEEVTEVMPKDVMPDSADTLPESMFHTRINFGIMRKPMQNTAAAIEASEATTLTAVALIKQSRPQLEVRKPKVFYF